MVRKYLSCVTCEKYFDCAGPVQQAGDPGTLATNTVQTNLNRNSHNRRSLTRLFSRNTSQPDKSYHHDVKVKIKLLC